VTREDPAFTINPFCLAPSPANLRFLFAFVKVLIPRRLDPFPFRRISGTLAPLTRIFKRIRAAHPCIDLPDVEQAQTTSVMSRKRVFANEGVKRR
jgi:hypothetical protein